MKKLIAAILVVFFATAVSHARRVETDFPDTVSSNSVTVTLVPVGDVPQWMAAVVQANRPDLDIDAHIKARREAIRKWQMERETNSHFKPVYKQLPLNDFSGAKWLPFATNMVVDLGPGDGRRELMFGFKYQAETNCLNWHGSSVVVRTGKPFIVITNPKEHITSQPMVQFRGFVNHDAINIRYRLFNENGVKTAQGEGLVNDVYFDRSLWLSTTNYFTCYDVDLSPGTNTFVIECQDTTGNAATTNFVIVFTTMGDTNPPNFKLDWPTDGMTVSGSKFTLRGPSDDPTAKITALITDDRGKTARLNGACERNGYLWVEHIPLGVTGKHHVTVVARDAAGNSSVSNLVVRKTDAELYMDPVADPKKLWQSKIDVTGFSSNTNCGVFVNGVKAEVKPDGHWFAKNVPVKSPNGGTANFNITTDCDDDNSSWTNSWLPTVFGPAKETLAAGISIPPASTNQYNHYTVYLGLTNLSGGDIRRKWVLPREEARFALHLYDKENREITNASPLKKSGQPLPIGLNIHRLGKNDLEQIDGVVDFFTNSTLSIATVNLDQYLRLPPTGEYRLRMAPRLLKIEEDGRLVPYEFPPVETTVQIRDQDSQIAFFLNELRRQGKLVWGAETNSLSVGVAHETNSRHSGVGIEITIFLRNSSNHDYPHGRLLMPHPGEEFAIALYDSAGKAVPKTDLGKRSGQPLSWDGQNPQERGWVDKIAATVGVGSSPRRRWRYVYVPKKDIVSCERFKLQDYFKIKAPGKYRLTYQQRFYYSNTNSTLNGITMPTVTVPLEIESVTGR
ncbi:MAG: hypothetical protein H0X66_04885 [Verrucomicrobia bacterium]|nr:hypothetical protein [Verrucomicrobiota bacterium]